MTKGLIADIQRASVHDGPGLRTTVFFKGCTLSCKWCHNPECICFDAQILQYPEKCIGCGMCDKGCFAGAKVVCGREMSAQDILAEILADKPYYGTDGGVTFSGGEPMAQPELFEECIDLAKANGIGCAVETSLICYSERIFRKLDLIMADLKIWDDDLHKSYTGVSNRQILENFRRLNTLGIPILARTPIIPEIPQGIPQIYAFLRELDNVKQYEILPYHPLGEAKRRALGLPGTAFTVPSKDYMKELEKYVFLR